MAEKESDQTIGWRGFWILVVLVITVQIVFGVGIYFSFSKWSDRGTFGDMFGAVNSLFSGLAFVGVIYAILLQRQELKLQRDELTLTRQELAKTAKSQERTAELMSEQFKAQVDRDRFERARVLQEQEPVLITGGGSSKKRREGNGREGHFEVHNTGATARNVAFHFNDPHLQLSSDTRNEIRPDQKWQIRAVLSYPDETQVVCGRLTYEDVAGNAYSLPVILNGTLGLRIDRDEIVRPEVTVESV